MSDSQKRKVIFFIIVGAAVVLVIATADSHFQDIPFLQVWQPSQT